MLRWHWEHWSILVTVNKLPNVSVHMYWVYKHLHTVVFTMLLVCYNITPAHNALLLSWHGSYISKMTYKPSKLGQTDLVFGLWSQFISSRITSLHIQWLWFVPPWLTHFWLAVLLPQLDELNTACCYDACCVIHLQWLNSYWHTSSQGCGVPGVGFWPGVGVSLLR